MANPGADEKDPNVAAAEIGEPLAIVEVVGRRAFAAGEEIGERQRQHIEDFLERPNRRTDAVLLDLRDEAVGHTGEPCERALRQTLLLPMLLQPAADIDIHLPSFDVLNTSDYYSKH